MGLYGVEGVYRGLYSITRVTKGDTRNLDYGSRFFVQLPSIGALACQGESRNSAVSLLALPDTNFQMTNSNHQIHLGGSICSIVG